MLSKLKNKHEPVLLEEIKTFIPTDKKINVIDATFGGGGYSEKILNTYNIDNLIAIDRDPVAKKFAKKLIKNFANFRLITGCFSKIDKLISTQKDLSNHLFDIIIFDLGLSSNQLSNPSWGFSFNSDGPLDMNMGGAKILASEVINHFSFHFCYFSILSEILEFEKK